MSHKSMCQAMIDAGIEDPDSREGILFCAGSSNDKIKSQCPYTYCVVFEFEQQAKVTKTGERIEFVKGLREYKVSVKDIALIMRVDTRTVLRWLKR